MEFERYIKVVKKKPNLNLPFSKVIYSDDASFTDVDKQVLTHNGLKIKGKPDYIIKTFFGNYIPVELKSSNIKDSDFPRDNEVIQLLTYFFLTSENYGKVRRGFLVYNDYMFVVKNNRKARKLFLNTLFDMEKMLKTGRGACEPSFAKCKYCVCRGTVCEFCDT